MRETGRKKMGGGRGILFLCRMSSLVKSCLIVDQDIRKIKLKNLMVPIYHFCLKNKY